MVDSTSNPETYILPKFGRDPANCVRQMAGSCHALIGRTILTLTISISNFFNAIKCEQVRCLHPIFLHIIHYHGGANKQQETQMCLFTYAIYIKTMVLSGLSLVRGNQNIHTVGSVIIQSLCKWGTRE